MTAGWLITVAILAAEIVRLRCRARRLSVENRTLRDRLDRRARHALSGWVGR